jgi:predicted TIM-barrel fold metal-dependent hydrolase
MQARRTFLKGAMAAGALGMTAFAKSGPKSASDTKPQASASGKRVKKIAIEEHCVPKAFLEILLAKTSGHLSQVKGAAEKLPDLGEGRIAEMDRCGVDMQVLSLSYPALELFQDAEDAIAASKASNDAIAEAVKKYPTRFSGFCSVPLQDPKAAADELERAITKLGFKALMVNENTPSRWLSDKKYADFFECLAKLNVPIYLHSDGPSDDDSGLHVVPEVMRFVESDLLVRHPNLQFILGHGGESLPFWLNRFDGRWRDKPDRPQKFSGYFKSNFYVTTSSQCWPTLLQFLIAALGSDRIMFATDYPYEVTEDAVKFMDTVPISDADREKICHLNAEKLFKL